MLHIGPLIQQYLPNANVGIVIADARSGKVIYQRKANQAFMLASNEKLLTATAAISYLGPHFTYETTASRKNNNIYFTFTGDPSLTINEVQQLVATIKSNHINNVVIDRSRFKAPYYAPGWTVDSTHWGYSAPISSVILNENVVQVKLIPGKQLGEKTVLKPGKGAEFLDIHAGFIKTVTHQQAQQYCTLNVTTNNENQIYVDGCWAKYGYPKTVELTIAHPSYYAKQVINQALTINNIKISGQIIYGKTPKNAVKIADHHSKPLSELLKPMLEKSNNVYAESFLKTLGYRYYHEGTFHQGVHAMETILSKLTQIDFNKTVLFDGSGQSRYDLVSPKQLIDLLRGIYHHPKIKRYIMAALPTSGIDGTLEYRMTRTLKGKVNAKTGTMKGISTLSGFLLAKQGQTLLFVMMMNDIVGRTTPAIKLQNKICQQAYAA